MPKRPTLLDQDLGVLEDTLKIKISSLSGRDLIPLFSILKSQTVGSRYGLGHSTHSDKSVIVYIQSWLSHGVHPSKYCNFRPSMRVEVRDPFSGELQYARMSSQYTSLRNIVLENLTQLYYYICVKNNATRQDFRTALRDVFVNEPGDVKQMLISECISSGDLRDLGHKRMAGYFKYLLYGDATDLEELCIGSLGYRYSFINPVAKFREIELDDLRERLQIREDVVLEDAIYIIYQNSNYVSIKVKDYGIVVIGSVSQLTRFGYIHLVSKYLWNEITIGMLQRELEQGLILKIPMSNQPSILKNCDKSYYRHGSVHTSSGVDKPEGRLNIEIRSVPFGKKYSKSLNSNIEVVLDDSTASACAGGVRLFRLNLNLCGPIYKLNGVKHEITGVSTQLLGERGILYNYLADSTRSQLDCTGLLNLEHKKPLLGIKTLIKGLNNLVDRGSHEKEAEPVEETELLDVRGDLPREMLKFELKKKITLIFDEELGDDNVRSLIQSEPKFEFKLNKQIELIRKPEPQDEIIVTEEVNLREAKKIEVPAVQSEVINHVGEQVAEVESCTDDEDYSDEAEESELSDWDDYVPTINELPKEMLKFSPKVMVMDSPPKESVEIISSNANTESDSCEEDYESSDWENYTPVISEMPESALKFAFGDGGVISEKKEEYLRQSEDESQGRSSKGKSEDSSWSEEEEVLSDWENYQPVVNEMQMIDLQFQGQKAITVSEAVTKPVLNLFTGTIPKVESVRDVIEWGTEMYKVEENLDEEPYSDDSFGTESDESDELSPDEPFFTELKSQAPGFYMSHITTLPTIIEYLIRGYTGLSDLVFVGSIGAQWEMIKIIIKSYEYIKVEKLPKELDIVLNYITAYFEDMIRTCKIPQWSVKGRIAWKTEDCCRLKLNFCKQFRTFKAAQAESTKVQGSQVEEFGENWLVIKPFSEDVIKYIVEEEVQLSEYIGNREFRSRVQDLEEMIRAWL